MVMVAEKLNAFLIIPALKCCGGEVGLFNRALWLCFIEMFFLLIFTLSRVFLRCNPVLIKSHCECWTFLKMEENTNVTHSVCHKVITPCHAHLEHVQITHAFWACVSSINGVHCSTWAGCILPLHRDTEKDNASDDKQFTLDTCWHPCKPASTYQGQIVFRQQP